MKQTKLTGPQALEVIETIADSFLEHWAGDEDGAEQTACADAQQRYDEARAIVRDDRRELLGVIADLLPWAVAFAETQRVSLHPPIMARIDRARAALGGAYIPRPALVDLVRDAVEAWPQFDADEDEGEDAEVNGGDLVEWFAQWRQRARQAIIED